MKNKSLIAIILLAIAFSISSCASQKYGCPMSSQNTRFNK